MFHFRSSTEVGATMGWHVFLRLTSTTDSSSTIGFLEGGSFNGMLELLPPELILALNGYFLSFHCN
jgi:hypothetical protein